MEEKLFYPLSDGDGEDSFVEDGDLDEDKDSEEGGKDEDQDDWGFEEE